jgi:hypothetical protein
MAWAGRELTSRTGGRAASQPPPDPDGDHRSGGAHGRHGEHAADDEHDLQQDLGGVDDGPGSGDADEH